MRSPVATLVILSLFGFTAPTALARPQPAGPISLTVMRDGRAVTRAEVIVRVMPPQDSWAETEAGEPVDMPVVASGLTDRGGRINLTPTPAASQRTNDSGEANFLAIISEGADSVSWWFPLKLGEGGAASLAKAVTTVADHRRVDLRVELGADPGVADMGNPPESWVDIRDEDLTESGLMRVQKTTAAPAGIAPAQYCYYYWTNDWIYNRNMPIGDLWSWSGAPMSHTYDASVTSTVGVAKKLSGGGMSASGTVSFAVTSAAGGTVNGLYNRRSYNQIHYRLLVDSCYLQGWWKPYATTNILYPINYVGPHPHWEPHCGTYRNAVMFKTAGSNVTYAYGINLGPISVSSHTNWKADNKLAWNIGSTSTRLCGSSSQGWVSSPRAEAHRQ